MTTITERRTELLARRDALMARMQEVERELSSRSTTDWEEAATEREDDEVLEGMGLAAQAEVARIDAALERIETGEYGHCMRCGEEISPARLDAVPDAPLCRNCAG
ncbi:TraR/DksA family transcriptional regulator [Rhodobaculum claviforme]|uniref:Dimethylmenaquinone methyltransferase n=1 Tax=Rhodobaculum claviforme TaxID=1549854 RepID=A0A934WK57_9RHOB|nr:TraR/DksA family transcriptional regulator [Rhodobaculum claviforme]MBK5928652.1 dimethylmenaquinone methyltransferase [Rhodobaculum claviforme]